MTNINLVLIALVVGLTTALYKVYIKFVPRFEITLKYCDGQIRSTKLSINEFDSLVLLSIMPDQDFPQSLELVATLYETRDNENIHLSVKDVLKMLSNLPKNKHRVSEKVYDVVSHKIMKLLNDV